MNAKQTIRSIRTERGISQETLAELLEVSRQTISKWENGQGRPSADSVAKLSEGFGLSKGRLGPAGGKAAGNPGCRGPGGGQG